MLQALCKKSHLGKSIQLSKMGLKSAIDLRVLSNWLLTFGKSDESPVAVSELNLWNLIYPSGVCASQIWLLHIVHIALDYYP